MDKTQTGTAPGGGVPYKQAQKQMFLLLAWVRVSEILSMND
jgi:hypothetical protein